VQDRGAREVKKRPRDANQLAKLIVDIASGQVEDWELTPEERGADLAASAMGKRWPPREPQV
jgi:hypothetical protein